MASTATIKAVGLVFVGEGAGKLLVASFTFALDLAGAEKAIARVHVVARAAGDFIFANRMMAWQHKFGGGGRVTASAQFNFICRN